MIAVDDYLVFQRTGEEQFSPSCSAHFVARKLLRLVAGGFR